MVMLYIDKTCVNQRCKIRVIWAVTLGSIEGAYPMKCTLWMPQSITIIAMLLCSPMYACLDTLHVSYTQPGSGMGMIRLDY